MGMLPSGRPSVLRPERLRGRPVVGPRAEAERLAFDSLSLRNFRAGLAPLSRLLLQMPEGDPERPVVLACLAVVYTELGRRRDAQRVLSEAAARATTARTRQAVRLAADHAG